MARSARFVALAATLSLAAVVAVSAVAAPAYAKPGNGGGKGKPTPTATATPTSTPTPTPTPSDPPPADPIVLAAVGDSITLAYDAAGFGSYPQYSWVTGTSSTVSSHLLRLQGAGATVTAANEAVVGAASADLAAQISSVPSNADYLTIEIGANDACTSTVAGMTGVTQFEANIRGALADARGQSPDAEIFLASIPNLYNMWQVSKDKWGARFIWSTASICQSLLDNPRSTQKADEDRRLQVQARVDAYNAILKAACDDVAVCTFDDFAVADYVFSSKHISTSDYFHPSVEGQRVLAEITWPYTPYVTG